MLPLEELDDLSFKQIVEKAVKAIPGIMDEWTDENYHDPGITFIDLFAWLTEMQQYHMNRITAKNELKFLKLLGYRLKEAECSRANVTFTIGEGCRYPDGVLLPRGTILEADGHEFETVAPLTVLPAVLDKVLFESESAFADYSTANKARGAYFYILGKKVEKSGSFYLGFKGELAEGKEMSIAIYLYEGASGCGEWGNSDNAGFHGSGKVSWEYYGKTGEGSYEWLKLKITRDETQHLSRSGNILFKIPGKMEPGRINRAKDKDRYWIRCRVEDDDFDTAPRVNSVMLNTVRVVQHKTLSEYAEFLCEGEPGREFRVEGYLPFYGKNEVYIKDGRGPWRLWHQVDDFSASGAEDLHYVLKRDEEKKEITICFGDGEKGKNPLKAAADSSIKVSSRKRRCRVVSFSQDFAGKSLIGGSNGLPNQVFNIFDSKGYQPVNPQSFKLQVGVTIPGSKEYGWEDWELVDDFDASPSYQRHYMLNTETGEIIFGDNEKGIIPKAAKDGMQNIRIIFCRTGGGEDGNVKEGKITGIKENSNELKGIEAANLYAARGGRNRETLEQAKRNMRIDLKKQYKAVTSEDYENIVLAIPELSVAGVKAIPLYDKDDQENEVPAQVTVVVVPYSEPGEKAMPVPSRGFLKTVEQYLDNYRLITTRVVVIPPEYIEITIRAVVMVSPHVKFHKEKIRKTLDALLMPYSTGGTAKWRFGNAVTRGDIFTAINGIDGVEYVKDLWLHAEGEGFKKGKDGDIYLPPHGLVYSGEHDIEIISRIST